MHILLTYLLPPSSASMFGNREWSVPRLAYDSWANHTLELFYVISDPGL